MVQESRNFIVDSNVLLYLYLTSMFIKTFTEELNSLFNFLFGAFLLLLSIFFQRNAMVDIEISIIDICYAKKKTAPITKTLMFSVLHE